MIHEEIRLYASHHQFYIQCSQPLGRSDDGDFWDEDAHERRLAVGDGLMAVGTGTYGKVLVRAEKHDKKPEIELDQWDHVTEANLQVRSEMILIMGCLSDSGLFFKVRPGHFRVRVCHANLALSESEAPADWTGEFQDWYLVQFWPSRPSRLRILKERPQP